MNENSLSPGPSGISGLALGCVWNVDEGPAYDVKTSPGWRQTVRDHVRGDDAIIAVRTLGGAGRIYLEPDGVVEAAENTLVLVDAAALQRYHCRGGRWRFWWFEFTVFGALQFPLGRLMEIPREESDAGVVEKICAALRRENSLQRQWASASFAALLLGWLTQWEGERWESPYRRAILEVIDAMHRKLADNWTVREMAAAARMSEVNFRLAFHAATRQAPKRFYDRLRLSMAQELLRLGIYNVGEVAERLNYSSPFHLSRAYRRHFGIPPSRARE